MKVTKYEDMEKTADLETADAGYDHGREYGYLFCSLMADLLLDAGLISDKEHSRLVEMNVKSFSPKLGELYQ